MEAEESSEVLPTDFLSCRLCGNEYKEPKYLPCLHSFCHRCLRKYIAKNADIEGYFACPTCATEVSFSEEENVELPDNPLARRMSGNALIPKAKERLCKFCKNAGDFVKPVSHCTECNDFLCASCTSQHQLQEETALHQIESADDYIAQIKSQLMSEAKNHVIPRCCEFYDQYDIEALFCVDCDISVCADCHTKQHSDHRCAELVAVATNFENKIKGPILQLENNEETLDEYLENLNNIEKSLEKQKNKLKKTINKRTSFLCNLIKEYETLLLDETDKRFEQSLELVSQQKFDLDMHKAAIHGVKDFAEKLLTYGSYEEKVQMRKKVAGRVRELCEEELPDQPTPPSVSNLSEPEITVETICSIFGELMEGKRSSHRPLSKEQSIDSDVMGDFTDTVFNDEKSKLGRADSGIIDCGSSYGSTFRNVKFSEEIEEAEFETDKCFNLEGARREFMLPSGIQRECLKGIGINQQGDIIIGAMAAGCHVIYILEKHGIVRGQFQIDSPWNIHSVSCDGKVTLIVARGDNRYKVRIMKSDGSGHIFTDTHFESFGLNFVTANENGNIIAASNRYAHVNHYGKKAKSAGNIAIFTKNGELQQRITNQDFSDLHVGLSLLEKPQWLAVDSQNHIFVADSGSHTVSAFDEKGVLLFEYGNTGPEEVYIGPDQVSTDYYGNLLVHDKRNERVDVLGTKGQLKKSFFTEDPAKFVAGTPDKLLMVANTEGLLRFYDYL